MAVSKVVYKHFEVKVSPAAAHAMDALLFGCGKVENDLNPDYNADLVNSVAFRASECKITRVVRKNADDENTVLYDGAAVDYFYLEYEPEDENDNGFFSITVKKSDGTDAMKVVTVPYGTKRRPVYATQDEALRARMATAEDDIDYLEQQMEQAETDIGGLEQQVTAILQKDAEQDEKIEALESTTAGTTETVNTLQENFNNLNDSVGNLGTAVQANIQDVSSLETKVAEVETTANNALPKTGGDISGTLKVVGGYLAMNLGAFEDMETAGWEAIKSWYNALADISCGYAYIYIGSGQAAHGLPEGSIQLVAYKTFASYGLVMAYHDSPPIVLWSAINGGTWTDFSALSGSAASRAHIPTQAQSAAVVSRMMLAQMPDLTDDDKLRVSGLYDTWTAGSHAEGDMCNAKDQTWECFQAHDNATYPDIKPDSAAWFTFWRPLHGKSPETARPFVPVQGEHDMYHAGEYMVWTDGRIKRATQDTAYSPADYAPAWEDIA